MSTAYYAMFHEVCFDYASFLVGSYRNAFDKDAWRRAYRSVGHGDLKDRSSNADLSAFCDQVQLFAVKFVEMQQKRHLADYDPFIEFTRQAVLDDINQVEDALRQYRTVSASQCRAFCAVLTGFKKR
ncbi:MAG: hypothetical protein ACOCYW_02410 [Roseicyclus sp.]